MKKLYENLFLKIASLFSVCSLLFACDNKATTTTDQASEDAVNTEASIPQKPVLQEVESLIELLLLCNYLGEDEKGNPHSDILLKIDTQEKKIAAVMGKAQSIKAGQYANYDIPPTATSACYSRYAGAEDYFYTVFQNNEIKVYRGRTEAGQTEGNYHWESMDWNQLDLK